MVKGVACLLQCVQCAPISAGTLWCPKAVQRIQQEGAVHTLTGTQLTMCHGWLRSMEEAGGACAAHARLLAEVAAAAHKTMLGGQRGNSSKGTSCLPRIMYVYIIYHTHIIYKHVSYIYIS